MAIMDIFKKKTQDYPMPGLTGEEMPMMPPPNLPKSDIPITQVTTMQTQGLTNNQIIQTLQRQGYQPTQIYDALAQAEARKNIEPQEQPRMELRQEPRETRITHPDAEAIAEQIIEEKWQELRKDLVKIDEWKDHVSSRVDKMEQSVLDLKTDLDSLHKAIVSRIGEYDKTLLDVGTEIKAMEKVFQKVLPELTGNIQELSRVTKTIRTSK